MVNWSFIAGITSTAPSLVTSVVEAHCARTTSSSTTKCCFADLDEATARTLANTLSIREQSLSDSSSVGHQGSVFGHTVRPAMSASDSEDWLAMARAKVRHIAGEVAGHPICLFPESKTPSAPARPSTRRRIVRIGFPSIHVVGFRSGHPTRYLFRELVFPVLDR